MSTCDAGLDFVLVADVTALPRGREVRRWGRREVGVRGWGRKDVRRWGRIDVRGKVCSKVCEKIRDSL